jgi:hypothetical protein
MRRESIRRTAALLAAIAVGAAFLAEAPAPPPPPSKPSPVRNDAFGVTTSSVARERTHLAEDPAAANALYGIFRTQAATSTQTSSKRSKDRQRSKR